MKLRIKQPEANVAIAFALFALVCVLNGETDWACVFLLFSLVSLDTAG